MNFIKEKNITYPLIIDNNKYYCNNNKKGLDLPYEIKDIAQLIAEDFIKDNLHENNKTIIYVINWDDDDYNCLEVMLYEYGITCIERFIN